MTGPSGLTADQRARKPVLGPVFEKTYLALLGAMLDGRLDDLRPVDLLLMFTGAPFLDEEYSLNAAALFRMGHLFGITGKGMFLRFANIARRGIVERIECRADKRVPLKKYCISYQPVFELYAETLRWEDFGDPAEEE